MRKIVTGLVILGYFLAIYLWYVLSSLRIEIFIALLGIGGVITTLYVNTLLSLHQQETQWKNDNRRREEERQHQRTALRIVLVEELKDLHSTYTEGLKTLEEIEESDSTLIPKDVNDSVFRSMISHLGILTESEVGEIVATYRVISRQNEKLSLLGTTNERMRVVGTTEVTPENYIRVPYDSTHVLLDIQKDIISKLETTISVLTKNLEITNGA